MNASFTSICHLCHKLWTPNSTLIFILFIFIIVSENRRQELSTGTTTSLGISDNLRDPALQLDYRDHRVLPTGFRRTPPQQLVICTTINRLLICDWNSSISLGSIHESYLLANANLLSECCGKICSFHWCRSTMTCCKLHKVEHTRCPKKKHQRSTASIEQKPIQYFNISFSKPL